MSKKGSKSAQQRPRGGGAMLTLRVSDEDRELLTKLVEINASRNALRGTEVSIASVVRSLIRREAVARGLLAAPPNDARDTPTP